MAHKRTFGEVSKLPSGRYRARFTGPDGLRHSAPVTFDTIMDADVWLTLRRAEVIKDEWQPPVKGQKFGQYSKKWLQDRQLKPRTTEHYEHLLAGHLAPLDDLLLRHLTPAVVADWYADINTGPTMKAHAYSLLRTILNTAVSHDLITANPCRIPRAGSSKRVHRIRPATLPEITTLVATMPPQYRAMTMLAAWCGLRYGELAALRRSDLEPDGSLVRVRRGIVRVRRQMIEGTPKSDAGIRDVAIPPHLAPMLLQHLEQHAMPGKNGLLFPGEDGGYLSSTTLYRYFHPARDAAGRPDLRWHDLRHTGAVLAAATGATLAELMARLGHSTPAAAMRYQHAAAGRDAVIAAKLSELVKGAVHV
jgi:integrase